LLPNLYPGVSKPLEGARMRFLLLGLGRQSVAMALMAERGLIGPKPDAIIVANMGTAERGWAQDMLRTLQSPNFPLSIPIVEVRGGDLDGDFEAVITGEKKRFSNPPMFVKNDDGSRGRITRGCTFDHKIKRELAIMKEMLGYKPGQWMPDEPIAEQWLGMSMDEVQRMQAPPVDWLVNRYPLIEAGWTVQKCERWLLEEYGLKVRHSGCYFCPFTENRVWLAMQQEAPEEFERACQRDEAMRHNIPNLRQPAFIHDSLQPLRSLDFAKLIRERQGALLDDVCPEGHCGL
jgi:hypothetical protein